MIVMEVVVEEVVTGDPVTITTQDPEACQMPTRTPLLRLRTKAMALVMDKLTGVRIEPSRHEPG